MREKSMDTLLCRGLFEYEFCFAVLFGNRIVSRNHDRPEWIVPKVEHESISQIGQHQYSDRSENETEFRPHCGDDDFENAKGMSTCTPLYRDQVVLEL